MAEAALNDNCAAIPTINAIPTLTEIRLARVMCSDVAFYLKIDCHASLIRLGPLLRLQL